MPQLPPTARGEARRSLIPGGNGIISSDKENDDKDDDEDGEIDDYAAVGD